MARDIIGLGMAVIVLAGFAFAIANGGQASQLLTGLGNAFANVIGTATHPPYGQTA